jgi:hypothetical protein
LLDLQVNGTSQFRVTSGGAIGNDLSTYLQFFNDRLTLQRTGNSTAELRIAGGSVFAGARLSGYSSSTQIGSISFNSSNSGGGIVISPVIGNFTEQRNATNAQTFLVYGTYTDASNYVRVALSSTSTAVTLSAETAGTGADNIPLNLTAAGTGTIKVNSVAEVVVSSTVAGLPAAPAVGMLTRVTDATAPAVGVTVVGGGAAAALVWYNGANWSVIGV